MTTTNSMPPSITCYTLEDSEFRIQPSSSNRDWMRQTPNQFARRCLPLTIANSHSWEILANEEFSVVWDGTPGVEGVRVFPKHSTCATSHFGSAIVTIPIKAVINTSSPYSIWVTGPINYPKDGIYPTSAVIESFWSPYSFTMNWILTRPGQVVHFRKGEPLCAIFPIDLDLAASFETSKKGISDNPNLQERYNRFSVSRTKFNDALNNRNDKVAAQGWQKRYHRGEGPEGDKALQQHITKLRLSRFTDS